jgi:hypothetical protein
MKKKQHAPPTRRGAPTRRNTNGREERIHVIVYGRRMRFKPGALPPGRLRLSRYLLRASRWMAPVRLSSALLAGMAPPAQLLVD